MSQSVTLKPIPELTEADPQHRLVEFFRKLGWDGEAQVDPTLVKLHEEDWQHMLRKETEHAKKVLAGQASPVELAVSLGFLWMNWGPSAGGRHRGMVELHPGWVEETASGA
jgi:hypothetical protein